MPTFETYDFEGDSRWKEYKTNTDVPHVSDAEGVEYRLKLRFYKKYIVSKIGDSNVKPIFLHSKRKKQNAPHYSPI